MTIRLPLDSCDHMIGSVNVHTLVFGVSGTFGSSEVNWFLERFLQTGIKAGEQSEVYKFRVGVGATGLLILEQSVSCGKEYACAVSGTKVLVCCACTFAIML